MQQTETGKSKNWFARHKILTGILGVILFLIVLGVLGSGSDKATTIERGGSQATGGARPESPAATQQAPAPPAKIGDTVTDSDLAFTVTEVSTAKRLGGQFFQRDAQGTFHVVTLKIENRGKETRTTDSSQFKIVDSQGREFERSVDGQTAAGLSRGKVDLFLQQIQPGLSFTGDIIFDLPADATGIQLIAKGTLFSKGVKILLEK